MRNRKRPRMDSPLPCRAAAGTRNQTTPHPGTDEFGTTNAAGEERLRELQLNNAQKERNQQRSLAGTSSIGEKKNEVKTTEVTKQHVDRSRGRSPRKGREKVPLFRWGSRQHGRGGGCSGVNGNRDWILSRPIAITPPCLPVFAGSGPPSLVRRETPSL